MYRRSLLYSMCRAIVPVSSSVLTPTLLAAAGTAGNNNSIVTASVSWAAGDLIVVALNINFLSGGGAWSVSATGLTFTTSYDPGTTNRIMIFTAIAASSGSSAITLSANTFTSDAEAYQVIKITPTGGAVTVGTVQAGSDAAASTTNSVGSLTGYDANDYLLAFTMLYNGNGAYGSQTGTPRAGWTQIANTVGNDGTGWAGWVHSQISPQGGEATASISGMLSITNSRMIVLPLILT